MKKNPNSKKPWQNYSLLRHPEALESLVQRYLIRLCVIYRKERV